MGSLTGGIGGRWSEKKDRRPGGCFGGGHLVTLLIAGEGGEAKRREEQPDQGRCSHTVDDTAIGTLRPLTFGGEIKGVFGEIHTGAPEGDAFRLQPQALFQTRLAGQTDVAAGAQHPVPGNVSLSIVKGPSHLAGSAGKSGSACDVAVGSHATFRDPGYGAANFFQHGLVTVYGGG